MPIPKYDDIPLVIVGPEIKRDEYGWWIIGIEVIVDGDNVDGDTFYRNTLPEADAAIAKYVDNFKLKLKKLIRDQSE